MHQWSPNFNIPIANIDKIMVWGKTVSFNVVYYDKSVMCVFSSMIGYHMRDDVYTLKIVHKRFVSMFFKVYLNVVVGRIVINEKWYQVKYENLYR